MTEPKRTQQQVQQSRRAIRQQMLMNVARLYSEFYKFLERPITNEELKDKTFKKLNEMDQKAANETDNENDYKQMMNDQRDQLMNQLREELNAYRNHQSQQPNPDHIFIEDIFDFDFDLDFDL